MSAQALWVGATLRLHPQEAPGISVLDSADIEVTDSHLPHAIVVEHLAQHCRSETLGMSTAPRPVILDKASCAWKPTQASSWFSVELLRGPAGFGLILSGCRDGAGNAPLAVRGLLKDGAAQCCSHLQIAAQILKVQR
ncbi:PDZ domain-containing protein MAGIX isoform X2 [Heterocephalus glaber]|uniref:PDZ domain-containing protein MAGIX isoform X2 n=1 Tax=Heterocephalus glaber TaxID=10181 RepID=A0AAX6SAW1_HETGA|nr:PDZ domain-containing protein MAGIX isoform X2 [Heterocephalus glaber]